MWTRHHEAARREHGGAFGGGGFGAFAEAVARFFGTPQYLIGQTVIVIVWIALNGFALLLRFDPYPFILLNLVFSLQAAYAAPLILLAQTRQAARDKAFSDADARHREQLSDREMRLLEQNTRLTEEIHRLTLELRQLTAEVHERVAPTPPPTGPAPRGRHAAPRTAPP
jgi:uncharacterized membrane protein